jgi:hypothetical protein
MKVLDEATLDRFFAKVAMPSSFSACWPWSAGLDTSGYGKFWFDGAYTNSHRFAYSVAVGTPGDGLELDHLCRARSCVNPLHLEPVTHRENVLRGHVGLRTSGPAGGGRRSRTHCLHGHPYSVENTRHYEYRGYVKRVCVTCVRECGARRRDRMRAAVAEEARQP